MIIKCVEIHRFKRFDDLTIEFTNQATQEIASQYLILGDNGSGKTTVLQAIALTLSLVSSICRSFENFPWQGWVPGRFMRWGPPRVELVVNFSEDENRATQELARPFYDRFVNPERYPFVLPPDHSQVTVILDGARYWTEPREGMYQFKGRHYAGELIGAGENWAYKFLDRLPGIFWFDQFRNLASPGFDSMHSLRGRGDFELDRNSGAHGDTFDRIDYEIGVAKLRQYLNSWKLAKLSRLPVKYIDELEGLYRRVFPSRQFDDGELEFRGTAPAPENTYFLLKDEESGKTYDLEEMSSGEQSVFPILYHFVRRRIRNSVVLIDEVDLNLHPPHSQALLALLPHLGPRCQFLLTTHSRSISTVVSPHQVLRLPGGQPCL